MDELTEKSLNNDYLFHFLHRDDPAYRNSLSYSLCELRIAWFWFVTHTGEAIRELTGKTWFWVAFTAWLIFGIYIWFFMEG